MTTSFSTTLSPSPATRYNRQDGKQPSSSPGCLCEREGRKQLCPRMYKGATKQRLLDVLTHCGFTFQRRENDTLCEAGRPMDARDFCREGRIGWTKAIEQTGIIVRAVTNRCCTGQRSKDSKDLLQGQGLQEAHPAQSHPVQSRQGMRPDLSINNEHGQNLT